MDSSNMSQTMKGRRRKTLNAGEIEEFLSELNSNNSENYNPNIVSNNNNSNNDNKNNSNTIIKPNHDNNNDNNDSMENMIRKFSKLTYSPNNVYFHTNTDDYTTTIARKMHITTGYKLLPARTIYPEQFSLPPSSLESKKNLVLSLSPMITDGEKQRLYDADECERFTRCKVEKSRMRNGNYEYYDIDINAIISIPDYESRYYAFIESKKIVRTNNHNTTDAVVNSCNSVEIVNAESTSTLASSSPLPPSKNLEEVPSSPSPPPPPSPLSPLSPLSNSAITLTTLASTTILSSSLLTSIVVDDKITRKSPEVTAKTNNLIDNLANELDAILANADGDMINDTKNKDKKKRNKMRRSIISMDYLEDLSLVDDDNDDKKLLWKSAPDSTDINTTNTIDTIDTIDTVLVQANDTNCDGVSNNNDNINDENKQILENIIDVSCRLESTENVDAVVDMTDSIGINNGDDFTHEVIIPTDDHDEIVVSVEEYIEHSAVLTSTDSLVTNSDSIDTSMGEITITSTNTIDLYDSCVSIGNDISNNEDDHANAEDDHVNAEDVHANIEDDHANIEDDHVNAEDVHVNAEDVHVSAEDVHVNAEDVHFESILETDNDITDNKARVVENNDVIESCFETNTKDIASTDGNGITNYITNTEEYLSNEECKVIHNETIETIEKKAFMRLNIRFEQARWKYQWELVSYYAALQARNKLPK